MERPYPYMAPYWACLLVLVILTAATPCVGQTPVPDSSLPKNNSTDTAITAAKQFFRFQSQQVQANYKNKLQAIKNSIAGRRIAKRDSVTVESKNPFKNLLHNKPLLSFTGGYAAYYFNFRSAIDTPYVESNVYQNNITGRFNFLVAGQVPIQVNYWLRQTNSTVFRNIADVQVTFSQSAYRNQLQSALQKRLLALSGNLKDSLTDKLYALKNLSLTGLKNNLQQSFSPQKIAEAYEVLNVKGITYKPNLPDSVNIQREDSLRKMAAAFLQLYTKVKGEYDKAAHEVDSLKEMVQQNLEKISQYQQMINSFAKEPVSAAQLRDKLDKYGLQQIKLPAKYRWLMGLRNFSLGRSTANYSELTAKNISISGISFEYNSWYYLAVAAGTVNYRFRDFVLNGSQRKPQTLLLLRAGLGQLEKNYFILSVYRGQKQLFAPRVNNSTITITGVSAEAKWRINATSWITAEAAKSMAPDFRNNPAEKRTSFDFSDKTNQAYAVRLYTYIPKTASRLEAFYKQAGANFQSFNSFQTNAALESWYVKAEQNFLKRKLRVVASLRKNEFSNPFIAQQYKSNTVFKSITASLRIRKWPVITAGYQPMSQLTVLDNQVTENRFQSLVVSGYHLYKIKSLRTATTVIVNRFYNSSADSGFLYYNATNLYWMQQLFFSRFTANVGLSHTNNPTYRLNVFDAGFEPRLGQTTIGIGFKINNLNKDITKIGGYINAGIPIYKQDVLHISYEHGYLPGFTGGLISNEMATIQFVKMFR